MGKLRPPSAQHIMQVQRALENAHPGVMHIGIANPPLYCGCCKSYEPIGSAEFAEICGASKQAVWNWLVRYPDFPRPVLRLKMGPIWLRWQARYWDQQRKRLSGLVAASRDAKEQLRIAKQERANEYRRVEGTPEVENHNESRGTGGLDSGHGPH